MPGGYRPLACEPKIWQGEVEEVPHLESSAFEMRNHKMAVGEETTDIKK
jgi:hypothetical protein